jgi:hypothetical protein
MRFRLPARRLSRASGRHGSLRIPLERQAEHSSDIVLAAVFEIGM